MAEVSYIKYTCDKCGYSEDLCYFESKKWTKIKVDVTTGYSRSKDWCVCSNCWPRAAEAFENLRPSFIQWIKEKFKGNQ